MSLPPAPASSSSRKRGRGHLLSSVVVETEEVVDTPARQRHTRDLRQLQQHFEVGDDGQGVFNLMNPAAGAPVEEFPRAVFARPDKVFYLNCWHTPNLWTIPPGICILRNLRGLSLRFTGIRVLPSTLGRLKLLTTLDLASTELAELPAEIGGLESLTDLDCSRTKLRDLPRTFGSRTKLENLCLTECVNIESLSDDSLRGLVSLKNLDLFGCLNLLHLPDALGDLPSLRLLGCGGCKSLRISQNALGRLPELAQNEIVWSYLGLLQGGVASGRTPWWHPPVRYSQSELYQMLRPVPVPGPDALCMMDLGFCRKEGVLPLCVPRSAALETLLVSCMSVRLLPCDIGRLQSLRHLNCSLNRLRWLPESILELGNLEHLDVSDNEIEALPEGIGRLQSLSCFLCKGNDLCRIPRSIGALRRLTHLYVSRNPRLWSLPDTIGALSSLEILDVSWNKKLSELPETIGNLHRLEYLYASNCCIRRMPSSIGHATSLHFIDWGGNPWSKGPSSIGWISGVGTFEQIRWKPYPTTSIPRSASKQRQPVQGGLHHALGPLVQLLTVSSIGTGAKRGFSPNELRTPWERFLGSTSLYHPMILPVVRSFLMVDQPTAVPEPYASHPRVDNG